MKLRSSQQDADPSTSNTPDHKSKGHSSRSHCESPTCPPPHSSSSTAEKGLPAIVRAHDIFNLIFIGILNLQNVYYLATGKGFNEFFMSTMLYFLADLVFVGARPLSVKSPLIILAHHIITALYILIPYSYPQYAWCMSYAMLVEINTWLLIAKRTLHTRYAPALEVAFLFTWVLLRNILYPYLIYAFFKEWRLASVTFGSPWNPILLTPIFQLCLTGLNMHWTVNLIKARLSGGSRKQL
ncbi:MAG: hypothetical protein WDW38_002653 [Sanguina aurantia]